MLDLQPLLMILKQFLKAGMVLNVNVPCAKLHVLSCFMFYAIVMLLLCCVMMRYAVSIMC